MKNFAVLCIFMLIFCTGCKGQPADEIMNHTENTSDETTASVISSVVSAKIQETINTSTSAEIQTVITTEITQTENMTSVETASASISEITESTEMIPDEDELLMIQPEQNTIAETVVLSSEPESKSDDTEDIIELPFVPYLP